MYRDYVHPPSPLSRVMNAAKAANLIQDGVIVGMSGFARAGEAKAVPQALTIRAKERPLRISLMTGADLDNDLDKQLTETDVLARRIPFQVDSTLHKAINAGEVMFIGQYLSKTVEQLRNHQLKLPDAAIIEAAAITERGHTVPTTSMGSSVNFAIFAKQVTAEIDLAHSTNLGDLHDIYIPTYRPTRTPIPPIRVNDRIGNVVIPIPPEKIAAIVINDQPDSSSTVLPPDDETQAIANHLIDFLKHGIGVGRMNDGLDPLQAGIGSIANVMMCGLIESLFENLTMYSEVLQDSTFDLIDAGKLRFASDSSITLSPQRSADVFGNLERYRDKLVLHPQGVSSRPEVIRRLGVISISTVLEFGIYGNVDSTHVGGTKMMNGIDGSGDFARNAHLTIFVTKSVTKGDNISSVVLIVSHVNHIEHDVNILITEQGLAGLRGLAPRRQARVIIENCVHPSYQAPLLGYFEAACARDGHTPHLSREALAWHLNLEERGHMLAG